MHIVYDVATRQLTFDTSMVGSFGAVIEARLNRHGQTIVFDGLRFGAVVTTDGQTALDVDLPPPGVVWKQTDQDILHSTVVQWRPDQTIHIRAFVHNAGRQVEAETAFVVPRPAIPFGTGWVWHGERWLLSINEADADTLDRWLDGVGQLLAQQIIAGRPWASVSDLETIPGISPTMVADWDGIITV